VFPAAAGVFRTSTALSVQGRCFRSCRWSADGEAIHQGVDQRRGVVPGMRGQVGVSGGGQNGVVTKDLLHFQQVDPGLDQMGGIAMPIMPRSALET